MLPALIALGTAAASIYGQYKASEDEKAARAELASYLKSEQEKSGKSYDQIINDINSYYDNRGSLGTASDVNEYKNAIASYDPSSFVYTPDKTFDQTYTKSRDDFINPYYSQIIQDTSDAVQHSAAGAGLGRGSGAAYQIAKAVAEKNNELYKDANEMYNQDREFAYNQYSDYIKQQQDALATKMAATNTKLTMQGNLANDYYNVMDSRQSDLLKARQDKMANQTSYSTAMAGLI